MIRQIPLPLTFNPEYDFEEFHPGANAEAVAHLAQAATTATEPLIYLWSEAGQGKTHLMHACCRQAHHCGLSVSYLPLLNVKEHGPNILEGLETQALVCLDDIDNVAGQPEWETALFSLFNQLRDRRHSLFVTASMPPAALSIRLPDLKTRLGWGLTLMLRPLSDEDKLQALSLQARALGLDLPSPVGRFLLAHYRRDLPSLRKLLLQLDHATLAAKRKLTIPFLKAYLEETRT